MGYLYFLTDFFLFLAATLVETSRFKRYIFNADDNTSCFWNSSGYVFSKDLFTRFQDFLSQIGVVILVTPKQEMERKSECFCGWNCFCYNLKIER